MASQVTRWRLSWSQPPGAIYPLSPIINAPKECIQDNA
ncbi:hypothetical protein PSN_3005 [Pseudomonas sp. NGC7]